MQSFDFGNTTPKTNGKGRSSRTNEKKKRKEEKETPQRRAIGLHILSLTFGGSFTLFGQGKVPQSCMPVRLH